jgi:hypothetical protein
MEREWVDPIFSDDDSNGSLCFDSCDHFGEGCRNCERVREARANAQQVVKNA